MDAGEADLDIKLQKISRDLLGDFDKSLPSFLRKPDGHGGLRVRSHVRANETNRLTSSILDPFQELPQLLDPYLPKWIPLLSSAYLEYLQTQRRRQQQQQAKRGVSSALLVSLDNAISQILYTFCKIRGEKVIVRFLNVETRYLELLLSDIEDAEPAPSGDDAGADAKWSWQQRYVVLLWLAHLLLAPFDLSTISSVDLEDLSRPDIPGLHWPENLPGLAIRVIPLAIKYLATSGKERDAAKALLVRLSMRRDMQKLGVLDSLVNWALACLRRRAGSTSETPYFCLGVLSFLAGALRAAADTSDMSHLLTPIFQTVHAISTDAGGVASVIMPLALARKTIIKVLRSVVVSRLRQAHQDMESTELTETTIGYLLESLADNDTPVRLAASKSLSIIALKLDPEMASQVVEAVLESLNRNVLWHKTSDGPESISVRDLSSVNNLEWHGLMLTLSHLLYRRSPPAEQLSDIIHALLLGLSFEQRGTSGGSIGTNVRDAACFGIWALARRYSTQELIAIPTKSIFAAKAHPPSSSILQVLGTELVTAASLDPVGNIRRGASAALQELIGRHPDTVERGIDIVQTVDYHTVARRSRAIQEVAVNATRLSKQYGEAIMDGILGWRGMGDIDAPSRRVSGKAFGGLTAELCEMAPDKALSQFEASFALVVKQLHALKARQVEERHGLLLCLAAILDEFPRLLEVVKSHSNVDGQNMPPFIVHAVQAVTAILEELAGTAYRKPDMIAEAASQLAVSSVPLLQMLMLSDGSSERVEVGHALLSSSHPLGYEGPVQALDASPSGNSHVSRFVIALKAVVSSWLARNEPEAVEWASKAALVLLMFSGKEERRITLVRWADLVRHKPTSRASIHGNGYFHVLANSQPLVKTFSEGEGSDLVYKSLLQRWTEDRDMEIRVAILQSLRQSRLLQSDPSVFLNLLSEGLDDYTTNARGDVGSHVRVEALRAVKHVWTHGKSQPSDSSHLRESVEALFRSTLRLSAEKLDRVRPEAQTALATLMRDEYLLTFGRLTFSSMAYFQTLLKLLTLDCLDARVSSVAKADAGSWMAALMAGYVTSADTGNDDLVMASRAALTDFCETSQDNVNSVCQALYQNLRSHQGQDRVSVPTMEIAAFLFHTGLMQRSEGINYRQLCLQVQKAGYKTGNVRKILACVKVYGGVAGMGSPGGVMQQQQQAEAAAVQEARKRLGALMLHPWPRVRNAVVDELWGLHVGQDESAAEAYLTGVDWAKADKGQIKAMIEGMRLV
ncbi:tubulin folding cofactor D C terminal-domain-containing protein [Stachybotrys elegans]|uniref:Tubulin folding cofactor D C terminal-domain-containing protein n=1 Tax=Stachybotrys elegans TaxID=80388 RepID=A0A8K0T2S6_9HYPO|nr:tubulin folding cofactor D C terminal-domain-containing protein [Stachybotrys elegans]